MEQKGNGQTECSEKGIKDRKERMKQIPGWLQPCFTISVGSGVIIIISDSKNNYVWL